MGKQLQKTLTIYEQLKDKLRTLLEADQEPH